MIHPRSLFVVLLVAHLATTAPVETLSAGPIVDLNTVVFKPGQFVTLVPSPQATGAPAAAAPESTQIPTEAGAGTGAGEDGSSEEATLIKEGQALVDYIKSTIQTPDPTPQTHREQANYTAEASTNGLVVVSEAKTNSAFPVDKPEVIAFFKDITGDRPVGPEASSTLYVHEVTINPELRNQSDILKDVTAPIFSAEVGANKANGALIMVDWDLDVLTKLLQNFQIPNPILLHQHIGAAAEKYAVTGNPFPVQWIATSARIVDDEARAALQRIVGGGKWQVPNQPNRYELSVDGAGENSSGFRELAGTSLGSFVINAVGDYHGAFSDNQPTKLHIYYEGSQASTADGSYLIWELGKVA